MPQMDFLSQARQDLESLLAKHNSMGSEVTRIEIQIRVVESQIEQVKGAIAYYTKVMGTANGTPSGKAAKGSGPWDHLRTMTIAEACEDVMQRHSGFAHTVFLVKVLREAGKLPNPKTAYGGVVRELQRHPSRFRKVAKGQWALISTPTEQMTEWGKATGIDFASIRNTEGVA